MRKNSEHNDQERQAERMDIIIALLLDRRPDITVTMADKVSRLANLGLNPAKIGRILGRPANYVSAVLSAKNRKPTKSKRASK